jgi:hypothetical protein
VALRDPLEKASIVVTVPTGSIIFGPAKEPETLLLLLEGGLPPLGDPVVMLVQDLLKRLALVVQTDV